MKTNLKQLKNWIAALDSGEYEQAVGQLQSIHGYCCLGVACAITIPKHQQRVTIDGILCGSMPCDQPHAPAWLISLIVDFKNKTGSGLEWLNDDGGHTFPEIATLLELVYIHKMLD